jgi:putative ATP-dependent endonuclease of the OLD family
MISRIVIKNFKSIKNIDFKPTNLCALVGENNVGKSNILSAINLVLGDKWPPNQVSIDDICDRDTNLTLLIQIYFDIPLVHSYYGSDLIIHGFSLEYNENYGAAMHCLDRDGSVVQTQYSKPLPMNNAIREQITSLLIGVNRNLEKELSGSQWTLLGRILKDIEDEFQQDPALVNQYETKMKEACDLLKIASFSHFESILKEQVKKLTGFINADLKFTQPKVINQYKSLELHVQESGQYGECSALDMGSGIQSAITIALIQAYRELKKKGAIILIEEPEVYLHPHARRYFYHLLKDLSDNGNQVFYTTHSTEFVSLPDYDSLCIIRKKPLQGTQISRAQSLVIPPASKDELKLLTQFDAKRNELFFARRAILVEGQDERIVLPYIFAIKSIDINENGISIIDVGGKENLDYFINIVKAFSIPFVVLHDEDRNANNYATYHCCANGRNSKIRQAAGDASLVFSMDPDFENVLGLQNKSLIEKINKVQTFNLVTIPQIINDAINKLMVI